MSILIGIDGNAFSIMGVMKKALRKAGCKESVIWEYIAEATKGDYDNLLVVSMAYEDKYLSESENDDENV
jgi:hypothetical protein